MSEASCREANSPDNALIPAQVSDFARMFSGNRANRIARNAVTSSDVLKAARNPTTMRTYHDTYGISRKRTGQVTNQRQSGRCWLFATYNVARAKTMELLDVDTFEFSQAYGMFYDKLEKANAFLCNICQTASLPTSDRTVSWLLDNPISDGGEFRFAANLIAKWGMVPKDAMPETACSKNSSQMNTQLERLLRHDAVILRKSAAQGADADDLAVLRKEMLEGVHRMLSVCLGEPPERFDFEVVIGKNAQVNTGVISEILDEEQASSEHSDAPAVSEQTNSSSADCDCTDKSRRLLRDAAITPQEFCDRYVQFDPTNYVELISVPGDEHPFNHLFGIPLMDTVMGGNRWRFLNVDVTVVEQAAIASLKAGVPCYMACDVMQQFGRHLEDFPGVLACDTMDFEGLFDVDLSMTRAEMFDSHETSFTHAMTFQGVELNGDASPRAWRVENSWGKDACKDGYLIMSADWFRTYGANVVVERRFVDEATLNLWDTLPIEDVAPWSGLGGAFSQK